MNGEEGHRAPLKAIAITYRSPYTRTLLRWDPKQLYISLGYDRREEVFPYKAAKDRTANGKHKPADRRHMQGDA